MASVADAIALPECLPDCAGANLHDANLNRTDLSDADLSGANLTFAYLVLANAEATETALSDVAGHSAVASGEPLDAAAGEPLVGRQGPVNAPSMRATRSAKGVQVAAVR